MCKQSRSTQKALLAIRGKGFSIIEAILAAAVFSLLLTAFAGIFASRGQSSMLAGQRARAVFLVEEGLEATRNIRDENFSNLSDGTHGLNASGSQWSFSGSSDTTDIFTREIIISSIDADWKQVTSRVTWPQNPQRTGSVSLVSYLTNWKPSVGGGTPASCAEYCQALPAGYVDGACRQNEQQCANNSEIYEAGGDPICVTNFPGDPSRDTCCCKL